MEPGIAQITADLIIMTSLIYIMWMNGKSHRVIMDAHQKLLNLHTRLCQLEDLASSGILEKTFKSSAEYSSNAKTK